uniref:VWFA domain-containing protein n=1 Tax=Chelonoidis abingdonii TaxID=106734 RepID=A0A8C0G8W7_CHEAB
MKTDLSLVSIQEVHPLWISIRKVDGDKSRTFFTMLALSRGFSVDVEGPITFQEAAEGFGQSVLQFRSASDGGLIIGAPLQTGNMNETGKVYKCDPGSRRCQEIPIQSKGTLSCVESGCTSFLSPSECPKHVTDIALLIDGSGSIASVDFRKIKTFISEIMKRFRSTDTQFALMQYSNKFTEHFDFSQYRRSRDPDSLVQGIEQLTGGTHTASAIRKVMQELFTSGKGARDEATKILMVITDGVKSGDSLSYSDVIPEAERAGIIRYSIGVSCSCVGSGGQHELQEIASEPTRKHIFRVDNFNTLECIETQLQDKIIILEGNRAGAGAAVALGIYMVGAPLCQGTGKVLLFSRDTKGGEWTPGPELLGDQTGSYFGSILCAVDLDRDGNMDLILIGAPMYHTPLSGGRVYICPINLPVRKRGATLHGQTGEVSGHFGASMSEIGDISGDGQMDVAIGAPMENDNHGALYIFHGEKGGLSPQYRQRIEGSQFPNRLQYFGQVVSGGTDLTGDGLPDIVVGAQGQVLLLRSRPVLKVRVDISFQPSTIPTSAFDCQGQEQLNTEASRAEVCFTVTKSTKDSLGDGIFSTIQYSLALDPGRTKIRVTFNSTGPVLSRKLQLSIEKKCERYQIMLPVSVGVSRLLLLPLPLSPLTPALLVSPQLPFQKGCGTDGRCDDQLEISFNFSGLSTLVVGVTPEINTTVSIQNHGQNSYSTTVQFSYPAALSYRRVLLLQVPQHTSGMRGSLCRGCCAAESGQGTFRFSALQHGGVGREPGLLGSIPALAGQWGRGLEQDGIRAPGFSSCSALWRVCFFQVKNLRQRSVPISVTFEFPVELSGVRVWDASEVVPSKVPASPCPCVCEMGPVMPALPYSDCSVATCKKIRCRIASLEMQQPLEFMIKGTISFQWVSQTQQQNVSLVSEARIEYEKEKYTQKEGFIQCQVQTVVERSKVYNYLPIIVGSSVGGLVLLALITAALYKLGFFKRQYKQMMEDAVEGEGSCLTQKATAGNPPASDTPKQ